MGFKVKFHDLLAALDYQTRVARESKHTTVRVVDRVVTVDSKDIELLKLARKMGGERI